MFRTVLVIVALALPASAQNAQSACHAVQVSCPCPASIDTGGCQNSTGQGGWLNPDPSWAIDSPSISQNIITLTAQNLPPFTAVMFCQGTTQIAPVTFGDGVRCIGGTMIRLGMRQTSQFQGLGYASIGNLATLGQVPAAGGIRWYQAWYRNAVAFCTAATFNMTNAVGLTWVP